MYYKCRVRGWVLALVFTGYPGCAFGEVSSLCMKLSIDSLRGMSQDAVPRAVHTLTFREAQGEGTGVEDVPLVNPEPEQPLSTEGLCG